MHFLFTYILLGKTYFLQPFLFSFVATSCFVICTRTRLFSYMLDIRQERYYATLITWGLILIYCLQVGQTEKLIFIEIEYTASLRNVHQKFVKKCDIKCFFVKYISRIIEVDRRSTLQKS